MEYNKIQIYIKIFQSYLFSFTSKTDSSMQDFFLATLDKQMMLDIGYISLPKVGHTLTRTMVANFDILTETSFFTTIF